MPLKKFGTGQVVGTEGQQAKTAGKQDWTPTDDEALARENAQADKEED